MNDKELDSKENYEKSRKSEKIKLSNDGHNALISSIISQSVDSSGDTPQKFEIIQTKQNFLIYWN